MGQFNESSIRRDGDGKFAEHRTGEALDVDLDTGTAPAALADAVPAGGTLTIGEDEFDGFYDFESIDVTRNDDGTFHVAANTYVDVKDGLLRALAETRGFDAEHIDSVDQVESAVREIDRWLDDSESSEDLISWIEDTTGARMHRESDWDDQQISWETTMPADATTDQVIAAAESARTKGMNPDAESDFYVRALNEAGGYRSRRAVRQD